MMKGLAEIGVALTVAIVVGSTIIVLNTLGPVVNEGKSSQAFTNAKNSLALVDRSIQQLMLESVGARRQIDLDTGDGTFIVSGTEEKIKIRLEGYKLLQPGTSVQEGNILIQSGGGVDAYERDVDGDGSMDLVLKNNILSFAVKKLGNSTNNVSINTTNIITQIFNNRTGTSIRPGSGIYINDILESSYGSGYTALSRQGTNLGETSIILYMKSDAGIDYEALFTLAPGYDFIEMEVKNIK
jgi:hypothetical protein